MFTRNSLCLSALLLLAVLFPTASLSAPVRMTQEQAVQIARTFCRRIAAPVGTKADAQLVVPDPALAEREHHYPALAEREHHYPALAEREHHWQARWKIVFPRQAEVEVVEATGVVVFYTNNDYAAENPAVGNQPAGSALSQEEVIRRATAVLQATGQVGELAFGRADLDQTSEPPTVLGHTWFVCWNRVFAGIPYEHEGVNITLDAETGEVRAMGIVFHAAPPRSGGVVTTQETAQQTALAALLQRGADAPQFVRCTRLMVQPNTFWQEGNETAAAGPQTERSVWRCQYAVGMRSYMVWVDTETGKIIGGSTSMRKPGDPISLLFGKSTIVGK